MTRNVKINPPSAPVGAVTSARASDFGIAGPSSSGLSDPVIVEPEETSSGTIGSTQRTGNDSPEEGLFAGEVVKQIESVIDSFRTGKVKKSQSIYKIGVPSDGQGFGQPLRVKGKGTEG